MIIDIKRYPINFSFMATGTLLLLILFIRVTRGLDLTDEMQYYGEIKGLIESGKLFSNDLFIQQAVYILFYPVLYLYHLNFGFDGLVFFGRLVMAVLSVGVFVYAYTKLVAQGFPKPVASLTALSLTFAIPYHGIFAPSYNTVAQILWIIFMIRFYEWQQRSAFSWGSLPIIMVFAHPTSAVMMSLLIFIRLFVEREYRKICELLSIFFGGALIAALGFLYFSTPQEYLASLTFTSGWVGTTFFSSKSQPIALFFIYALFGSCLLFWKKFHKINFSLLASFFIAVAILWFSDGLAGGAYTARVVNILSFLTALAYSWSLSNSAAGNSELRSRINWLVVALLSFATTLGMTSGNGIGQSTGAFMVGLPLLLGIAVSSEWNIQSSDSSLLLKITCVVLIPILFVAHWSHYPYREDGWWQANHANHSVPEFRFISTTQERDVFISHMQHALRADTQGKRTLIISEYPGLYLALGAHAETCMLYMHSLTSDKSEEILLNCLSKKTPEVIVDIFANNDIARGNPRIKNVMHNFYYRRGFKCIVKFSEFNSINKRNPELVKYSVCELPAKRRQTIGSAIGTAPPGNAISRYATY